MIKCAFKPQSSKSRIGKNLLYQKVGSFRAVSNHLEQLERQLRSSMPQHVMDMLGQQAAYLSQ